MWRECVFSKGGERREGRGHFVEDVLPYPSQVKTAKPHLKQLQQCVKMLSNEPESSSIPPTSTSLTAESFEWLTREQTYVIVYLVRSLPPRVTSLSPPSSPFTPLSFPAPLSPLPSITLLFPSSPFFPPSLPPSSLSTGERDALSAGRLHR